MAETVKKDVMIAKLVKKGSPDHIQFNIDSLDDGDKWFINCKKVKNKAGSVKESALITRKDFYSWMRYHTDNLGWDLEFIDPEFEKYIEKRVEKVKKS